MTASASALAREGEVRSKISKVRAFSRVARVVCSALFGFGLVGALVVLLINVLGVATPGPDGGAVLTTAQKVWGLPMFAAVIATWLAIVHQLYRVFGNLAAGSIYTAENVRRVRNVGLLNLLLAVLGIVMPAAWAALVASGVVGELNSAALKIWFSWSDSWNSFVTAGLILLVSWIMDVGLYEKDHADALRRDADLVI